ncbi:MAG: 2-oxoacid:acceptor oxidoreductase subunit alpha [Deltaproteobacteria bacterium]|nr:2-oxoacid:acceptor oxidoreductase subunit alpha [Deltaproteobacteria bacterium]MCB9788845.1 2-oxoacid:acceptor oxidoreductase subunit alpha [Deltaproteobacteria bacterium]
MNASAPSPSAAPGPERKALDQVVIRFAGDSGDGMQITGSQFTQTTALAGNDLATFPDFPAEIRAPAGTTFGVSAFQIHFANHDILTPGDAPDVLVAMNPAALKVNLPDLKDHGLLIVNTGAFTDNNLRKAGYTSNPLTDQSLEPYRLMEIDVSKLTLDAVQHLPVSQKESLRCKNFWTLGLMYWLYGRDTAGTIAWLRKKFSKRPDLADANIAAMNAGHAYGETAELPSEVSPFTIDRATLAPGEYTNITGSLATAWGLATGANLAGLELVFGSYPITPASPMLHTLANLKQYGVVTYQAEDEIAAVCAAIGASYAGALGVTASSGPGIALKMEAIGLAISTELPLVIVNVQRGGPSTGLPTKTEQSDLLQAVWGRNGDAPLVVLAASTPSDCFEMAIEAVRLATRYMTPVFLLTDGYLANGAEPWRLPDIDAIAPFPVTFRTEPEGFHPFLRNEELARNWAVPGTVGLEHRIGGLEKDYASGNVSYDDVNHQKMTWVRDERIRRIADHVPEQSVALGEDSGELVVVGWGSTFGAIHQAVKNARRSGLPVSQVHVRYLNPLPRNLGELLGRFKRVLVPEMNNGQLVKMLRAEYLVPAEGLNKVSGKPFKISEIEQAIRQRLES